MSEAISGEYILIITMSILIAVIATISIIVTSVYASRRGLIERMTDEKKFLSALLDSKSCECVKKTQ